MINLELHCLKQLYVPLFSPPSNHLHHFLHHLPIELPTIISLADFDLEVIHALHEGILINDLLLRVPQPVEAEFTHFLLLCSDYRVYQLSIPPYHGLVLRLSLSCRR